MHWKPEGQPSVAPYLIVTDAQGMLDFMSRVFGAEVLHVQRHSGGGVAHAEARIDDSVVMVGQAPDGPPAHVHVWVSDPQAALDTALRAGAEQVQPVRDMPDGNRRGGVRIGGITWWISRHRER